MVASTVNTEQAAKELAAKLHGRTFGETIVQESHFEVGLDAEDEPTVYLLLQLSDPRGETWPYDDILSLRKAVLSTAREISVPMSIHVRLQPTTDLPQEDDELPDPDLRGDA